MGISDGKGMDSGPADLRDKKTGINKVNVYKLVRDAYNGTGGFRDGSYLVEHKREANFKERQGYSYNLNYFRPILDSLINPVFKRPAERVYKNDEYKEFEKDCDRNGTHLNKFMKKLAKRGKRDGCVFVVMDTPSEQPISKAEALEKRTFPYVYLKYARDVFEYEVDKSRKLLSIVFREWTGIQTKTGKREEQYRKWFPGGWELYKKIENGELKDRIDSGVSPNGVFNVIPVFFAESEEGEGYLPHPPLYDIARLNAAIYNVSSELREVQRKQGFSILALPTDGSQEGQIEVGSESVLGYPHESRHKPEFINAEVEQQRSLMEEREKLTEETYKQAKIAGVTGVVKQSGIAKQWDFEATDVELAEVARICEFVEAMMCNTFQDLATLNFDFIARYPEQFGVFDIDQEIERTTSFLDVATWPVGVKRQALSDLASNFFKHLEPKKREDLLKEIGQMTEDELYGNQDLDDKDEDEDKDDE